MAKATKRDSAMSEDAALTIVRRLEPVLSTVPADLRDIKGEQRWQGERLANLEGRVSQIPTLGTLAAPIVAIFGFAFVILRFAAPSIR